MITHNTNPHRILIVDDHPMVRAGLAHLIADEPDLSVCGEADGIAEALRLMVAEKPDLAIIDLSLADGSGLDLIERIKARDTDALMLVASMHDEFLYAERVLAIGARGYINKQKAPEKMIEAIRRVLAGKVYLSEPMTERLLNGMVNHDEEQQRLPTVERLTNRELMIFELIGEGRSTCKIAKHLNLSVKTIESHQANIKKKLALNSAHELTRKAILWLMERG